MSLVNSGALGYYKVASYVISEGSFAKRLKRVRVLKGMEYKLVLKCVAS